MCPHTSRTLIIVTFRLGLLLVADHPGALDLFWGRLEVFNTVLCTPCSGCNGHYGPRTGIHLLYEVSQTRYFRKYSFSQNKPLSTCLPAF